MLSSISHCTAKYMQTCTCMHVCTYSTSTDHNSACTRIQAFQVKSPAVMPDKVKHQSLRRVSVLLVLIDHSWAEVGRGSVYKHSTHGLAGTDTVWNNPCSLTPPYMMVYCGETVHLLVTDHYFCLRVHVMHKVLYSWTLI